MTSRGASMKVLTSALALAVSALLSIDSHSASAQTAAAVDVAVVAGGNTNDVQLSYGAGIELFAASRVSSTVEALYVRDFFEFEPDDPLTDAMTYSGVTSAFATVDLWPIRNVPARKGPLPYIMVGAGWLRASTSDRSEHHFGYAIGAGLEVINRDRLGVRLEGRHFAAPQQ